MKTLFNIIFYTSWFLWLFYSLFSILNTRSKKRLSKTAEIPTASQTSRRFPAFLSMVMVTVVIVSLFFLMGSNYQSDSYFYIEKYVYQVKEGKSEITIGNARELSDITIENKFADQTHVKLVLQKEHFFIKNISNNKKVDINGRYLNKLDLQNGDEIEINGKEKIKIVSINNQFPLGRSITVSLKLKKQSQEKLVNIPTLLNKRFVIKYGRVNDITLGFNTLILPSTESKTIATIAFETDLTFFGINIYYFIVFLLIAMLSVAIFLYLKNQFNGAFFLLFIASLPFMAGFVSVSKQLLIVLAFCPLILYCQIRRRTQWKISSILLIVSFVFIFFLPRLLSMGGDFTFKGFGTADVNSYRIVKQDDVFFLKDIRKKVPYQKINRLILGYTQYQLMVNKNSIELSPLNPERIKVPDQLSGIVSDLMDIKPGHDYVYMKFPQQFKSLSAEEIKGKDKIQIKDSSGNSITLSRFESNNYKLFLRGLLLIVVSFWLFWFVNNFGFSIGKKRYFKFGLFSSQNFFVYHFVYFMLSLGYIMFGALSLYNNYFLKNFEKYRSKVLLLFLGLFFLLVFISRYNKWLIFAKRLFSQKKFLVPIILGLLLLFLGSFSKVFLFIGFVYFIFIFFVRLRKDLINEYRNSYNHHFNLKDVNEKTITNLNKLENQRIFFGLGRALYNKGWDYFTSADLLLLLSLFFIVLQIFLGGELGVSVAGFFFLPIELGKILLTLYFADWVSRIDKGMELNVLWIYGLVLVPFLLLIAFLKDFSPLLVFSFVFLYHIIKIKKSPKFKVFLFVVIFAVLIISVSDIGDYSFPFKSSPYNLIFVIIFLVIVIVLIARNWLRSQSQRFGVVKSLVFTITLIFMFFAAYQVMWYHDLSVPKVLGDRISSWLNPWQDYNLSYQYINSIWLIKGTGLLGDSNKTLEHAVHVPLIEQDLSFSLYAGVLGLLGIVLLFGTLLVLVVYIHQLVIRYRDGPFRWEVYVLEFLTVIFAAQFIFPALYVVGLLPIMSQPLPFLAYSNNMLLLFSLPFAFLMVVVVNSLEKP